MLSIIQKKYKDRYRTEFCDQDFYKSHQELFKMWKTRLAKLSNVEKVQAWVVALSCLRRPKTWFGGKRQEFFLNDTSSLQHSFSLGELFNDSPILIPPKLNPHMNVMDFINEYRINAFPESCSRSLCYVASGRYPLIISEATPTPLELLNIQISGKRIITINENFEEWPHTLYANRDFLGFVMHDLIHADHFFYEPQHRDGQLGFLKFMGLLLNDENLHELLKSPNFKSGFEYIISDMNSHPLHLFQTLRALLKLELNNETLANSYWEKWVQKANLQSEAEALSLNFINTMNFKNEHAIAIELLCIRLGQQNLV